MLSSVKEAATITSNVGRDRNQNFMTKMLKNNPVLKICQEVVNTRSCKKLQELKHETVQRINIVHS